MGFLIVLLAGFIVWEMAFLKNEKNINTIMHIFHTMAYILGYGAHSSIKYRLFG